MARTGFSPIRKGLTKHDREALIGLLGELYALSPQNRAFLDARFTVRDDALQHYKKVIRKALYPDSMSSGSVSFRAAKQALADYRKALGSGPGLAELTVYAAECGNEFTCDFGDMPPAFYKSLVRVFASAAQLVATLDPDLATPLVARLDKIVTDSDCIGWGYSDSISAIFSQSFPDAPDA